MFTGNVLAALLLFTGAAQQTPTTTIILVRHAEAVANAGNDPVLTDAGIGRAKALAEALKDADVRAILTTQYQRTILTGEPLASASKAELVKMPVAGPIEPYAAQIVRDVHSKYAGGVVVIIGHSNTIPAIVKALSGLDVGEIAHDSYDQLFIVVTASQGSGRVVRARYGA